MPTNKDFKKIIRARMEKTGEAYTTARAILLRNKTATAVEAPAGLVPTGASEEPVAPARTLEPERYAALAGMSDAAIKRATGCTWEKWVQALDYAGAESWSHRAIADYVHTEWKVKDWWTQTVTVGYERIKGLRAKGQRRDGGFEANKSKAMSASAAKVFRAFVHKRERRKWLPDSNIVIKRATPNRSVRMTWDDGTPVEVWITSKGKKATAQVQHRKLADQADAERRKAFWQERLNVLAQVL